MVRRVSLACVLLLLAVSDAHAQRAIFLVRHAEKLDESQDPAMFESNDPPLSAAGRRRATALASVLKDAGITAIYSTEYLRNIKTAEPLAKALKLPIRRVPARDREGLLARLRAEHREEVVLVVGHSNTLPVLLKALGHQTEIKIADDEYDNLFVAVPRDDGPASVLRLRF